MDMVRITWQKEEKKQKYLPFLKLPVSLLFFYFFDLQAHIQHMKRLMKKKKKSSLVFVFNHFRPVYVFLFFFSLYFFPFLSTPYFFPSFFFLFLFWVKQKKHSHNLFFFLSLSLFYL
ncbi:hypothetical protein BX661DRAFT_55221 [Kickxella alabastrina]|uniref:uncharacterized protein n=1 Tax=Kickxella alabastrina TaxID=61397 RepID=UPI00221F0AD4|nr:uncharacterized protein BX661DRAFT_55221 [Kickxella alabastrina]KAI7823750.1 hypothetical protein BX661DRAFT_55221 [Kickxella alabastrina]